MVADEVTATREDPVIRGLARRLAGDPALADDLLQETWYAVAHRVLDRRPIGDLRGYFIKVMAREAARMRGQLGATLADDFVALSDRGRPLTVAEADLESGIDDLLLIRGLLDRLRRSRAELAALVPRRSADPGRYQRTTAAAAEAILRITLRRPVSSRDWREILTAGYPEWYTVEPAMLFQRLSRARADVRQLLQALLEEDQLARPAPPPAGAASQAGASPRTPADTALTALFLEAEQAQLPHETPYDLTRELALFTAWLDSHP